MRILYPFRWITSLIPLASSRKPTPQPTPAPSPPRPPTTPRTHPPPQSSTRPSLEHLLHLQIPALHQPLRELEHIMRPDDRHPFLPMLIHRLDRQPEPLRRLLIRQPLDHHQPRHHQPPI